jgi:hypothetical protein
MLEIIVLVCGNEKNTGVTASVTYVIAFITYVTAFYH